MTKSAGSLAEGTAKSASDASEATVNAVMQNVSESTPKEENNTKERAEASREMFGGLDLAGVKSAIDDSGPMGPPEKVEGGVYKQIFAVNKNMLASLLRMEQTMKMLLSIEYERITSMQQADVQQNLIEGDTDDSKGSGNKNKNGLLGRAASGAGSLLGGAFSKTKGAFSGNFGKVLGLGAIIFLFKKFETEIKNVTVDILKYFKSVYDVFKDEGLGAAFKKIGDDLKNEFLPKIKNITLDFLDMMFTVIKEAVFGASGSKRIQQEAASGGIARKGMSNLAETASTRGGDLSKMKYNVALGRIVGGGVSDALTFKENRELFGKISEHVKIMGEISDQADGRIQWSTFPGFKFDKSIFNPKNLDDIFRLHPVEDFIDAMPVIDGVKYPDWSVLSNINLKEMGGIDRTMSKDRVESITKVLAAKTDAYQAGDFAELSRLQGEYLKLEPTIFESQKFRTTNTTPGQTSLSAIDIMGSGKSGVNIVASTGGNVVDKSVKVSSNENYQMGLASGNNNLVARILTTDVHIGQVSGFSVA
jgi:hypothetical protein